MGCTAVPEEQISRLEVCHDSSRQCVVRQQLFCKLRARHPCKPPNNMRPAVLDGLDSSHYFWP